MSVGAVFGAVSAALEVAKLVSENQETIEKTAQMAAPAAQKAAEVGSGIGSAAIGNAGKLVNSVGSTASGLFGAAAGAVKERQDARAQRKALLDARSQVLATAVMSLAAVRFERDWSQAVAAGVRLPLESPGYYALVTYEAKVDKDSLGDYAGIFMGRSENMGASVHRHLSGGGNPDVYADVKYGKNVMVYAFPDFDDTDDNNVTLAEFVTALGAHESYNARDSEDIVGGKMLVEAVMPHGWQAAAIGKLKSAFGDVELTEEELCGNGLVRCLFHVPGDADMRELG